MDSRSLQALSSKPTESGSVSNTEMLRFYWDLGRDIIKMKIEQRWGEKVMARLSMDLREAMPGISGLTQRNIYYCKQFYLLYSPLTESLPQAGAKSSNEILPQLGAKIQFDIFCVPWGHHKLLIDKFSGNPEKALFFIRQTVENGWSRSTLLNFN